MSDGSQGLGQLRGRVLRGLAWKVGSQVFIQGSRVVVAIVLARLLAPHDYGVAAMVIVLSGLVLVFSDLALGSALVQRRTLTEADRSTVFWTSVGIGALCTLVGIVMAGPVAAFYGEPEVKPLFAALSLSFLITSLATTQSALLNRELDFRALELRKMAGTFAGAIVGIALAATGFGPWAIITQQLAIAVVSSALLWRFSAWRPRFTYSMASLRDLGSFGGNVFGTRLLFYANRSADAILIGRFLGPAAVGAYTLAFTVVLFPFNQIASPIQEVLYPAFSRMQDEPKRMATVWITVNRLVGAVSIPALIGLVVVAPEFVHTVLGEKWSAAVPVIQVLAWVGLMQSLQRLNSSILQARDRTGELLRYSIIVLVASLVAFVAGLPWGIVGVAVAYAIASTLFEPYYTWLTARALEVSLWTFVRGLFGVVQASLAMLACLVAAKLVLLDLGVSDAARLGILVALGIAVYVPCCLWRVPEALAEVRSLRRSRKQPSLVHATPLPEP
jgi:O-antigen/teichoic acid export membrane protein